MWLTRMSFSDFKFVTFFLISVFLKSSVSQVPACNGCCSNTTYREINEPRRSTRSVWKKGELALCDRGLQPGWYRFTSFGGSKMPETMVRPNHCGTHAPIWLNGRHPSKQGEKVDRKACINAFDLNGGCYSSLDIGITNCGDFFVYYLQPPLYCAVAYCAGAYLDDFVSVTSFLIFALCSCFLLYLICLSLNTSRFQGTLSLWKGRRTPRLLW